MDEPEKKVRIKGSLFVLKMVECTAFLNANAYDPTEKF